MNAAMNASNRTRPLAPRACGLAVAEWDAHIGLPNSGRRVGFHVWSGRPATATTKGPGRSSSPSGDGEGPPTPREITGLARPYAHWRPRCAPSAFPG